MAQAQAKDRGRPRVSIVIPAFEEERRLPGSIRSLLAFLGPRGSDGVTSLVGDVEALAMIEKSRDRTLELAREAAAGDPRIEVIDNRVHRGKGYAVRSGMLRARGDVVFFMDADLSTPLAEVVAFLAHFEAHPETDVLIGSRALAQSAVTKKQTWLRRNMGRTFNGFVRLFGLSGITDTQCGFKAFRAEACREIFSRATIDGFAFDVEALMLARKLGYKVDVRPVRWMNSPDSKVRILIDPLKMLWDLVRVRRIVRRTLRAKPLLREAPPSISKAI